MPGSRLLLRIDDDRFDVIDVDDIYFAKADGGDSVVRTKRKRPYRTTESLAELAGRLPGEHFARVHRGFVINLHRVRQVRRRQGDGWEVKLDPPVNAVIPIARSREAEVFERLGWRRGR